MSARRTTRNRRFRLALPISLLGLAAVSAAIVAGGSNAASAAVPKNTSLPTISGTQQAGNTLTATNGEWSGTQPLSYVYHWLRCNKSGNSCYAGGSTTQKIYALTGQDVGNTVRVRVTASNSEGSDSAVSVPTAVIKSATAPPPKPITGCPAGNGTAPIAQVTSPARLNIDRFNVSPNPVGGSTQSIQATFHVSDTCNQSVSGALVYVTAVPFNQFSIGPEQPTDDNGNVTIQMSRQGGFPAASRQQLLVFFVRARKAGEPTLAGISTRRLVSSSVDLNR